MNTTTTQPESREDALIRLADQARASGVRLFQDRADGRFYASSRSQSGTYHRLTGFSCSCRGFLARGRCAHLAALHAALGWLETPEPTPPTETCAESARVVSPVSRSTCPTCHGTGSECGTVSSGRSWRYETVVCGSCHGAGRIAA